MDVMSARPGRPMTTGQTGNGGEDPGDVETDEAVGERFGLSYSS